MDVELNKIVWKQFFTNWVSTSTSLYFFARPALKRISLLRFVSKLCPLDVPWFIANWCIRGSNYVTIKAWFIGPLYRQRYVHFQMTALPLRSRALLVQARQFDGFLTLLKLTSPFQRRAVEAANAQISLFGFDFVFATLWSFPDRESESYSN